MLAKKAESGLPEGSPYARHIPALDGVRGLAIVGVMASHLFPGTPHSGLQRLLQSMLGKGSEGVDLFFALSGFLITGILYDSLADRSYFRKFYARRALRIFPLYYGVLLVYGVASLLLGLHLYRELLSFALYLQNTSLVADAMWKVTSVLPLPHFWSLAIEEQFYLVWPLTVFFLRKPRPILWFCVASFVVCPLLRVGALLHGVNYSAVHTSTLCRADSLLAGAALAILLRSPLHDRALRIGRWLFVLGVLCELADSYILSSAGLTHWGYIVALSLRFTAIDMASFGLLSLALSSVTWQRVFRTAGMRVLGKYSYGLYVLHLILFSYLAAPLRSLVKVHVTQNPLGVILIVGYSLVVLSFAAAYLSYQLYESRFLRMKRFFDYKKQGVTATAAISVVTGG